MNIDHRRGTSIAPGGIPELLNAAWNVTSDLNNFVEAVHRLDNLGGIVTHVANETSHEGFHAEWRVVSVFTVEGDLVNRCEVFDEAAIDDAIARFEELSRPTRRLENTASQVAERNQENFTACNWDAMSATLADDFCSEDRRRVINAGIRHGRDAAMQDARVNTDLGATTITSTVVATRGEHLVLLHAQYSITVQRPGAFHVDVLNIYEIDADERIVASITFDLEDFANAIAELDARYLAGEAAAHARTWSLVAGVLVAHNRRAIAATTSDVVTIDHRRVAGFAPGDGFEYIRAGWELDQSLNIYIEAAHRVNDLGAVFTWAGHGTSHEGFEAEWRGVTLMTVDGEMVSRMEVFDEGDLEAALAKFDQLSCSTPRLENAASRVNDRLLACFVARDWDAMAEILAKDVSGVDRRRVVNSGDRRGRDVQINDFRAVADLGVTNATSSAIATRGERLTFVRSQYSRSHDESEPFGVDIFGIVEIDVDQRVAAWVTFDLDDFDVAIAELDARYLASEGAAHAHVWSVIAGGFASMRRYEVPPTTPDCVSIDHRRTAAFAPGELNAYFRAAFDLTADLKIYVEAVHRLSDVGVVCTHVTHGVSHEGFSAEWREVDVLMVEGDIVNHAEIFDEADFDAALAKFEELSPHQGRLKNAASEIVDRVNAYFAARDWAALGAMMATDVVDEDRRRIANAGVRHGRDALVGGVQTAADLGAQHVASTVIATRGDRLALCRLRYSGRDHRPEAFYSEALGVVEIDIDKRVIVHVGFDLDDIDAAFEELDARYLAGEAAAHSQTWSVISRGNAAANRNATLPMTPDASMIDHRLRTTLNADDITAYVRATWDLTPELHMFIESVHRLNDVGTVVTHASRGTSQDAFEAEWRQITLFTIDGDLCNRCEIFDEAKLDAALARFAELDRPMRRLENAGSQVVERFWTCFASRRWDAMAETMADDFCTHDRRRVANAGVLNGRAAHITNMRAVAEVGFEGLSSTVIATRGQRLALISFHTSMRGSPPGEVIADVVGIIEIDADNRLVAAVHFDSDDIDAAFEELDARYLAGEAAAHARTWSVITKAYAALNLRALPATTPDWTSVDHRHFGTIEPNALTPNIRAFWDITSEARIGVATVHRLTNLGAVVAHATRATSQEGVEVESGEIIILMVDGDLLSRCEIFDEEDLDAALARFEELNPHEGRLKNAVAERFLAHFAARDWDALGQDFAENYYCDDRRRVVNAGLRQGRDAAIEDLRIAADIGLATNATFDIIATRGERHILTHWRGTGPDRDAIQQDVLQVVEHDVDDRIAAAVLFDIDDFAAAFKELDARYMAGEAAAHAHTWSLVADAFTAINRHELPERTPDWVNIDHRRGAAFAAGEMTAYIDDLFGDVPDIHVYAEVVHRLDNLGAVVALAGHGTSHEGFQAEWREIGIFMFDGDLLSRYELFDEADLDTALARFDELQAQAPRLENWTGLSVGEAASRPPRLG